jgi:hypothetical protein
MRTRFGERLFLWKILTGRLLIAWVERQPRFFLELFSNELRVISIFLFPFRPPFFLYGFLRLFLRHLFGVLPFGHDFSPVWFTQRLN